MRHELRVARNIPNIFLRRKANIDMVESGFTRKKVESLTLGEKLRKVRSDFRMSLADVSKATRIQVKYLELLEGGAYEKLPADVYVRGFLRSYARYLNIDEQALVKLYERERNIQQNLGHETKKKETTFHLAPVSLVVTSRTLVFGMIGVLLFGAFFYLYQEFKSFGSEPLLVIFSPENGSVVERGDVLLSGKTDRGAQVTLNGQGIFVDTDGSFHEKLVLNPGINAVNLRTSNRFQKEKSVTLSVEAHYTPDVADLESTSPGGIPSQTFQIEVAARSVPVDVSVVADGMIVFQGTLHSEERKTFTATATIKVSSNHGEATFVRRDEGEAVPLAGKTGQVQDVEFLKNLPTPSTP